MSNASVMLYDETFLRILKLELASNKKRLYLVATLGHRYVDGPR